MNKTLRFECRPGEAHWKESLPKWAELVQMLARGILVMMVVFSPLWFDGVVAIDQENAFAEQGSGVLQDGANESQWTPQSKWILGLLLLLLYLLVALGVMWLNRTESRRRFITLTDDTLSQTCCAPFGLGRLQRLNWQVPLREIVAAKISASPLSPMPWMVRMHLTLLNGAEHKIIVANWFEPGDKCLPPLKPWGDDEWFSGAPGSWMKPENQKLQFEAAMELPLVRALRERGVVVSSVVADARTNDLFASRAVKLGICTGLGLAVLAVLLMTARMHQHFFDGVPLWVYPVVVALLILAYLRVASTDEWRPPAQHHFIAVTLLMLGTLIAVPQLAALINGLGVSALEPRAFVVREGYLEAQEGLAGLERMELPGKQSRIAWLEEGTIVYLEVKQGRLGLWEYDDTPLRDAADRQGIR